MPVTANVLFPRTAVGMSMSERSFYNIAAGGAGLCRRFGSRSSGCMRHFVLLCPAYRASVPMLRAVFRPGRLIAVAYGTGIAADVTGGVASVIVGVRIRFLYGFSFDFTTGRTAIGSYAIFAARSGGCNYSVIPTMTFCRYSGYAFLYSTTATVERFASFFKARCLFIYVISVTE